MHKMLILLSLLLLHFPEATSQEIPKEIVASFTKGSVRPLEPLLEERILLIRFSDSKRLDRKSFVREMSAFFAAHPPTAFTVLHQSVNATSGFVIGRMRTKQHDDYRVHCLFKVGEAHYILTQIRIDEYTE